MTLRHELLGLLVCPHDKEPLLYFADESALYNNRLRRRYRIAEPDIPVLLIDEFETVDDKEHARLVEKAARDRVPVTGVPQSEN